MQQLVVRIPQQQKVVFEQLAQQQQQPVSTLVRKALDEYLETRMKNKSQNLLLKLADIGQNHQGPADLSSTYKDHLYGKKK